MQRVVVDTNIFIPAYLFGGLPGWFVRAGISRHFAILTSEWLLEELDEKLANRFQMEGSDRALIQEEIRRVAEIISPRATLRVIARDPDDDRVLECAVAGRADCIVTGDKDLLEAKRYRDIAIITLRQFHDRFFAVS